MITENEVKLLQILFENFSYEKNKYKNLFLAENEFVITKMLDKKANLTPSIKTNKTFVDSFSFITIEKQQAFEKTSENLVQNILKITNSAKQQNELTSSDLNIFRMFSVNEPMHSYIIANLLSPKGSHGQNHLFLNIFLDALGIKRLSDSENWIVTAEKGRIDILLKRAAPHSVVVIENKSNYAPDQENQLYRYWYQEIYQTIFNRKLSLDYILNPPSDLYQIIYLSPSYTKVPKNNSLEKPTDWGENILPSTLPIIPKHLIFSEFVVNWLQCSLSKIPDKNNRLKEYVKQYLEFWD